MTNTVNGPTKNDTLLFKLRMLDQDTLDTIAQEPGLIDELKNDDCSMRMIEDTVRKALIHHPVFADQLRQVFNLDFLTLLSINPMMGAGREWFVAIRTMLFRKTENFVAFKGNWNIPAPTVKFYGLQCLFPNGVQIKEGMMKLRIMEVTGLTSADIEGYKGQLEGKKRINDELAKTGDAARGAADIN